MFLIGILSTPFPYLLVAFSYLLASSFGIFLKTDKDVESEESVSNIICFQELNPTLDIEERENYNFNDFFNSDENTTQIICNTQPSKPLTPIHCYTPNIYDKSICKSYLKSSFVNRPPPALA